MRKSTLFEKHVIEMASVLNFGYGFAIFRRLLLDEVHILWAANTTGVTWIVAFPHYIETSLQQACSDWEIKSVKNCGIDLRHFYRNGPDHFLICIFDTKYAHRMQVMSPLSEISTDYETYALMLRWITYFFYKQLQKFLWNQTLTLILYRRCFIQFQMLFTCLSCLLKISY